VQLTVDTEQDQSAGSDGSDDGPAASEYSFTSDGHSSGRDTSDPQSSDSWTSSSGEGAREFFQNAQEHQRYFSQ